MTQGCIRRVSCVLRRLHELGLVRMVEKVNEGWGTKEVHVALGMFIFSNDERAMDVFPMDEVNRISEVWPAWSWSIAAFIRTYTFNHHYRAFQDSCPTDVHHCRPASNCHSSFAKDIISRRPLLGKCMIFATTPGKCLWPRLLSISCINFPIPTLSFSSTPTTPSCIAHENASTLEVCTHSHRKTALPKSESLPKGSPSVHGLESAAKGRFLQ